MTRKGYKHTELGEIPEDWEVKTLGDVAKFSKGQGYSKNDLTQSGTPIILYGSMYTSYKTNINNINTFAMLKNKAVISKGGEVIVPASGETAEDIAIASSVEQTGVIIGGDLNIIYPDYRLSPVFLANIISNGPPHFDLINRAQGKTVVHLHNDDLKNITIPLPPLPEQRAIASALSDVDALIEALDRLIDKKRKIKQGTMQQLLSGKRRLKGFGKGKAYKHTELGEIPEDWEVKTLGQVCSKRFNSGDIINNIINNNGKYPVIGGNGVRGYTDLYNFDGECCVIGRQGALCGNVRYFSGKAYMTEHAVVACVNNDNECRFLNHILSFLDLGKFSTQSAQPGLSVITLSEQVKIPLPPLPEQRAIASVLSDMDAEIEALEAKRKKYTRIKQGMMQDLLTGRVRLKF